MSSSFTQESETTIISQMTLLFELFGPDSTSKEEMRNLPLAAFFFSRRLFYFLRDRNRRNR